MSTHCLTCAQIQSFSGPYFPAFVSLCIQSKCQKIRTKKNSVFGHFSRSDHYQKLQDMSRSRHFLISEVEKIVRLLLLSQATNDEIEGVFSALKHVETYLRSIMGNNRLHKLMLMHEYSCSHEYSGINFFNSNKISSEKKKARDEQEKPYLKMF